MVQPEDGDEEEEEPGLMLRTKWSLLEVSVARRQGERMTGLELGKNIILTSISGGYRET
jgi:hypothetical protein